MSTMAVTFLQLPRELRDMIYGHLFVSTYISYTPSRLPTSLGSKLGIGPKRKYLCIFLTCKAIQKEASEIFFRTATFRFPIVGRTRAKSSLIPEVPASIQNVELRWRLRNCEDANFCWCTRSSSCHARKKSTCHVQSFLDSLSDGTKQRKSCTIKVDPDMECNLATVDRFIEEIKKFNGFRTLTLTYCTQPVLFRGRWKIYNDESREYVVEKLKAVLGPPNLMRSLVTQYLIFKPQSHRT